MYAFRLITCICIDQFKNTYACMWLIKQDLYNYNSQELRKTEITYKILS